LPGEKHAHRGRSKESLLLNIARDGYRIFNPVNEELLHVDQTTALADIEQIKTLLKSEVAKKSGLGLDIHISNSEALSRQISLPASTEENLYEVIQYEMDRYTPFSKEDVYFDYRIEDRIKEKEIIKVLLIVIRKEILKPVVDAIENSGIHLQTIDIVDQENHDHSINNVKLLRSHADIGNTKKSSIKWLIGAVTGLLLLTGATPLVINYLHIQQLSTELAGLEKTVQKVKQLQSEYTKMQEQVGYLISIKQNNPSIIELLNLLTRVIPDHTYVQRLSLEGGLLSIQGLSASASELIPILDQTGLLQDIRFAAPVTQSSDDGLERYSITAQVKPSQE
jgi:general secretion pathway protein L